MRNYNFEYLVEKVQVLNEMAKFSQFWRSNFPEFEQLYIQVQKKMASHPKAPKGTELGNRRKEYVARSLFDFLSKDELAAIGINKSKGFEANVRNLAIRDIPPQERIERGVKNVREFTPEYLKFAPKWGDATPLQQDFMTSVMAMAYPEKAVSKKFVNKLMDDSNIDAYFDKNLLKGGTSRFADAKIRQKEKSLKMELGDFYEIRNKAESIIKRLRKSKMIPKGLLLSIYHADKTLERQSKDIKKDEFFDLNIFKNTLEDLIDYRKDLIKNMSQMDFLSDEQNKIADADKSVLENMLNNVNVSIQKRQPITYDQIIKLIPKVMGNISDIVLKNYQENYEFESTGDDAEIKANRYQTVFDTLDDDLLEHMANQNLITPEEMNVLQKWRDGSSKLQQNIISKSSRDKDKAEEAQFKQDAAALRKYDFEKKGKEMEAKKANKGQKQPKKSSDDLPSNPEELKMRIEELMSSDDPDFEEIDRLSKKLKRMGSLNENSVMGYMTEQVHKDGFSDNRGKFVDRGFKKPKNYAHWLWLNEQ